MQIQKTTSAPSAPGIYAGLSNSDYHAGPGVSKSQLDKLAKSPFHYHAHYLSLKRVSTYETPAMRFGTAVHTAILEPEIFAGWVVMPDVDGRTKEGKAAKALALEEAASRGVEVIAADDYEKVTAIADSFSRHKHLATFLDTGHAELSVYWTDPDTGILCRCRPDWLAPDCVLDLKTTEDASPRAFQRSAYGWRYWVQAAYYLDGLAANGVDASGFVFAAIEKSEPYACAGYAASEAMIAAGREEYRRLLRTLRQCQDDDHWPGYGESLNMLDLPGYANELFTSPNDAIAL
jgi:hypothetical protein